MGFFSDITGGSLLSLGGNLISSFMGRSKGPKRVPIGQLVKEARAAGLHPLAALGVTPQYEQPQYVGDTPDIGQVLSKFGQDVDRASSAKMTAEERTLFNLKVKNAQLQNELLGQDIQASKQRLQGVTPSAPTSGPVNSGDIISHSDRGPTNVVMPTAQTRGNMIPLSSYAYESNKAYLIPSEEVAEAMEGSFQGMPIDVQMGIDKLWARAASIFGADKAYRYFQSMAPPRTKDMQINNQIWLWDGIAGAYEKVRLGSTRAQHVQKRYGYIIPARWRGTYKHHRPDNRH